MARMTTILYASAANLAALAVAIKPARDTGQPIRLIALEEFRGETEQNAGAVYVDRAAKETVGDKFDVLLDAIASAYPHLNVQPYDEGAFDVEAEADTHHMQAADDQMRDLRMELINAGGSAPANADAETLSNLIAAQRATRGLGSRVPVLPTPTTAGTVVPDSTPVMARIGADALVSESATGTSQEALDIAKDTAGEGSGNTVPGAFSPVEGGGAPERTDLSKVTTHKQADEAAALESVDLTGKTTVADKVAAITAARDAA
jgi:hypothetical protein